MNRTRRASPRVRQLTGTPRAAGYTFPAEWTRHAATWLSWPRPEGISFPERYHLVPPALAQIVAAIAPGERVCINVPNENYRHLASEQLRQHGVTADLLQRRVRFYFIPTDECWCRDHGPAFVTRRNRAGRREHAIVHWGFNAWGGKYPPFDRDAAVPTRVAEALGSRVQGVFYPRRNNRPVIMEGGAVDFNGAGTVLTTEQCLLNPNRNPHLSRRQLERLLCDFYGQQHVVWLGEGIAGDDTDGHVDDIARFATARRILTAWEPDPRDENHAPLADNLHRLEHARDAAGRPFEVIKLPLPEPVTHAGQRLPASYLNFYCCNAGILLPTFRQPQRDAAAVDILQAAFPKQRILPLDCHDLIWGLGAIHCLTQQQPA